MTDLKTTIEALRSALAASPKNVPLRLYLAKIYEENEMYKQASDEYVKATSLQPTNDEATLGLGRTLYRLKDFAAAKKQLLKFKNAESHLYLAKIFLAEGDKDIAKEHYEHATNLDETLKEKDLENAFYGEKIKVGAHGEPSEYEFDTVTSDITFKDIGGLDALKEEIKLKIVKPYQTEHIFKAYGKKAGGGMLLYGPPGCGKTLIAKATAGEIKANFLSLELNEILDMWRGKSEQKMHAFFEQARANPPTVVFVDEIDAIGASRNKFSSAEMKYLVNQFLAELDGISRDNAQILIIGATNMPWQLDSALKRPGRFDKMIFVPPPDEEARVEIFKLYTKDKPKKTIDYGALAAASEGLSGADIKRVVDQAVENLLPQALKENKVIPLTTEGLEAARETVRSSVLEWFYTVKNYIDYANQDGSYDAVKAYIKKNVKLQ